MKIAAFTCTCEDDVYLWADQYLAEVSRLGLPFYIHLDRCSPESKQRFLSHPLCAGHTEQDDPAVEYTEQHKQKVMDLLASKGHDWALHWDMDELWGRDVPEKFAELEHLTADYVQVHWVNCWGDLEHVRVDGVFASSWRVKLYNLQQRRKWFFDHPITYGCKMVGRDGQVLNGVGVKHRLDVACVHTGLVTRELRLFHKERWDRIYSTALRGDPNPLGFWNLCCDEVNYPPELIPNPYR